MNTPTLDCRGLACPGPVLRCKECCDAASPAALTVIVDNDASKENVSRFLGMQGYSLSATKDGAIWTLQAMKTSDAASDAAPGPAPAPVANPDGAERVVAFITADVMGRGDDTLGGKLMFNFLGTLPELGETLWRVVLVNGAVRLTISGSPVLDKLKALEDAGVTILVCGTCLDFFGILDKKAVGQTTNMLDVVTSLQLATKVIQI